MLLSKQEERYALILMHVLTILCLLYYFWLCILLLDVSGNSEKKNQTKPRSYMAHFLTRNHWNLYCIIENEFKTMLLLKASLSVHKRVLYVFLKLLLVSLPQDNDNVQILSFCSLSVK